MRTCQFLWWPELAGQEPCGAPAWWRIERGRGHGGMDTCRRHLSAGAQAILGDDDVPAWIFPI